MDGCAAMERIPEAAVLNGNPRRTGSMEDNVIQIVAAALLTATKVAGPVLFATLAIGLVLSIVQSATQIQEQTLTFVPKLVVAAVVLVLTGGWCLRVLEGFTRELFTMIPALLAS
jgi:flagellar biosynthetic protein FliQ